MPRSQGVAMRFALAALTLIVLVVPSQAQECQLPDEVVGRWQLFGCYDTLSGCTFDASRAWYFRADGSWLERQGVETVAVGTWCVVPCPLEPGFCIPEAGIVTLEIVPEGRDRRGYFFDVCTPAWAGGCPFTVLPEPRALATTHTYGENQIGFFDAETEIWQYVGRPVKAVGTSWSALKARF